MNIPIYQVDAFAAQVFAGNPAAVMPLDAWLADHTLQAIAAENNLAETAFLVARNEGYELRWFTPAVEVDLCGHATLASAHVLFEHLGFSGDSVSFHTRSGELIVRRSGGGLTLDFPSLKLESVPVNDQVSQALGATASEAYFVSGAWKQLLVFENEAQVAALEPDFPALKIATDRCVIATAPGESHDFVSRFFGPQVGIDEDPVTGSAHCALVPYWAQRLGKTGLQARQISSRGGDVDCLLQGDRVFMTGGAVTFLAGEVYLPA